MVQTKKEEEVKESNLAAELALQAAKDARRSAKVARKKAKAAATNPVVQDKREVEKEINKEIKESRNVIPKAKNSKTPKQPKALRNGPLEYEARLIADPEKYQGCGSNVNFNPVASPLWAPATLTHLRLDYTVAASTTSQIVLFPGHLSPPDAVNGGGAYGTAMDAVAYHSKTYLNMATGDMPVGPFQVNDPVSGLKSPANAFIVSGLAIGTCTNNSAAAAAMYWDNTLPYAPLSTTQTTAAHSRWRLVGMTIKVINETTGGLRGGSVSTVNFTNSGGLVSTTGAAATNQLNLKHNRSFKVHEIDDKNQGVKHTWTPRLQDMAYWHSLAPANPNIASMTQAGFAGAGAAVFLNAPPGGAQTYSVELLCNWMIAGDNYASITEPNEINPGIKPHVEQVVTTLQNTAASATLAPVVASAVPDNPLRESMYDRLKQGAYDGFSKHAHSLASNAVETLVKGFASSMERGRLTPLDYQRLTNL